MKAGRARLKAVSNFGEATVGGSGIVSRFAPIACLLICAPMAGALFAHSAVASDTPPRQYPPLIHTISSAGATFTYVAAVETIKTGPQNDVPEANIVVLSFVGKSDAKHGKADTARRPIVFVFNGGPGASSIFLNLGLLGPEKLDVSGDVDVPVGPHPALVKNPDTLLTAADLVFIDPAGTGFSRVVRDTDAGYFRSVNGDAASVAQVIERWSSVHKREGSPSFIMGESYGAVRAVEVARDLAHASASRIDLRGLILLSQSLGIIDTVQRRSNIVGQAVGLPTLAATAWFHKRAGTSETLEGFTRRAQDFATESYLPALYAGSALAPDKRTLIAKELADFTGVSAEYFEQHRLFLTKEDFRRLLLADKGLILGLYDTRYTGPLSTAGDPSDAIIEALSAAAGGYLHREFGIDDASSYRPLGPGEDQWRYIERPFAPTTGEDYGQIDYAKDLVDLMRENDQLRVFVASGYFDTAASIGADEYLLTHNALDISRIVACRYFGGHMFYSVPESRVRVSSELKRFVSTR